MAETSQVYAAASSGDLRRLRLALIAEPSAVNSAHPESGDTALHAACRASAPDVVSMLLEAGASPHAVSSQDGYTPSHRAAAAGASLCLSLIIRAAGLPPQMETQSPPPPIGPFGSEQEEEQTSPHANSGGHRSQHPPLLLHLAAESGDAATIDALVAGGAMVEERDEAGRTALHVACRHGKSAAATRLMQLCPGLVANRSSTGWTPLHLAARWGHFDCCVALIKAGADVDANTSGGRQGGVSWRTPLGAALAGGHARIATLLRTAGAVDETPDGGSSKASRICGATLLCGTQRG